MTLPYQAAHFLTSVPDSRLGPPDEGAEVAFAGRSNAGKSSALNTITNQKALARTSKTPGRTQQINFFAIDEKRRLVDLPGYGYAKVPMKIKLKWEQNLADYLHSRKSLRGLIMLMDVRHPLTDYDQQMLAWCQEGGLAVHILLTKSDKLKRGPASNALLGVRQQLPDLHAEASVQLFSALKKTGVEEVHALLDRWLA